MPEIINLCPKWQNFAKSVHTGRQLLDFRRCFLWERKNNFGNDLMVVDGGGDRPLGTNGVQHLEGRAVNLFLFKSSIAELAMELEIKKPFL